ncbi:hypothetical protein GCM10010211_40750 [Streptomyces albospinus]|uniref:Secreted protein n=1 Tax=Streptomyces albospinus TaxID=285515 RepID=A0ABQ2V644_9ACTN|nr:hypothetical protein [Streptomyces albospinus]GGU70890.1 hypothetical protein GCM10010211_40750 [Streptomyces albospinus]
MNWGSLASTLLGALIGIASTLTADRVRARRSRDESDQVARRQLYGEYLAALARTRNHLRIAARSAETPAAERARMAGEAFRDGNAYELRYQVAMVAPAEVVDASTAAFRALRDVRDVVESGSLHREESYLELRDRWEERFAELRAAMRDDVQRNGG